MACAFASRHLVTSVFSKPKILGIMTFFKRSRENSTVKSHFNFKIEMDDRYSLKSGRFAEKVGFRLGSRCKILPQNYGKFMKMFLKSEHLLIGLSPFFRYNYWLL